MFEGERKVEHSGVYSGDERITWVLNMGLHTVNSGIGVCVHCRRREDSGAGKNCGENN